MLGCPKCGRLVTKLYGLKAQTESQCTECFTKYIRSNGIIISYMNEDRIKTEQNMEVNQPKKKPATNHFRSSQTSYSRIGIEEEELLQG